MCSTNEDDFNVVDVAAMLGHHDITKLLLSRGARDSTRCEDTHMHIHSALWFQSECLVALSECEA